MSNICKTVKIVSEVTPGGHIIINESDLLLEHVLFEDAPEALEDGAPELERQPRAKKAK